MDLPPERTFTDGQTIIEQGEPAMDAYLVVGGAVDVVLERDGTKTFLASLSEGDIFGEAALFKGSDYGASIVAKGLATVQPIPPQILDDKIRQCDPLIRALIRMMMVRLRRTSAALAEQQET